MASARLGRLRLAGVVAVATLWTTMSVGMYRAGLGFSDERPLSYLGTDSRSKLLFQGGLLVAAGLLAAFSWFVKERFNAPSSFLAASLIGLAGQVVAAIVPIEGPGASHEIHTVAGLILGASLPVLMWRFAAGQPPGRWRTQSYGLFWLEAAACVVGVGLSRSMRAPIAEIVPALAFHLWIIVVTLRSRAGVGSTVPPPVAAGRQRPSP